MRVVLVKESANKWSIRSDKALLCSFSQLDSNEAIRFAQAWLSSFNLNIKLEYKDELNAEQDEFKKARST